MRSLSLIDCLQGFYDNTKRSLILSDQWKIDEKMVGKGNFDGREEITGRLWYENIFSEEIMIN